MLLIYNILFPLIFILFLPGMILKLIRRPGHKSSFAERFAVFSSAKKALLAQSHGAVWIHSVSVGETVIALSLIKQWQEQEPDLKFVLSTTTTTGQELAQTKAPDNVAVIFCPIDFIPFVKRTFRLVKPRLFVIFETEIWPNLISQAHHSGVKLAMVNARLSDNSVKGYTRFKRFIAPLLEKIDTICVQSQMDGQRFESLSSKLDVRVPGNLKFDQSIPESFPDARLEQYFGTGEHLILLAASTHPDEEVLIAGEFLKLKQKYDNLKLIIVPRHAERGGEIASDLSELGLSFVRKTLKESFEHEVDCLLADTTGEMLMFINCSDVVIMGKSLAGHDEGHNLIEPALMSKPIITGAVLKNFRFVLNVLKDKNALITIENDAVLEAEIDTLLASPSLRKELGETAQKAILEHRGAVNKTIKILGELI